MIYSADGILELTLEANDDLTAQVEAVSALLAQHKEDLCSGELEFCILVDKNNDVFQFRVNDALDSAFFVELIHYAQFDRVNDVYEFDILRIFETDDPQSWDQRTLPFKTVETLARGFVAGFQLNTLDAYLTPQGLSYLILDLEELTEDETESE